jgi:acyl-CoA thioesterase
MKKAAAESVISSMAACWRIAAALVDPPGLHWHTARVPGSRRIVPVMTTPTGAEAMFAADRASQALGITVRALAPGRAELEMTATELMVNGHGIVHGGYVFLLADTAFACACNYPGAVTVAASADIAFINPARRGDVLVAEAAERHRYGRSGVYDVTVTCDNRVIAEFRGLSRTLNRPLP